MELGWSEEKQWKVKPYRWAQSQTQKHEKQMEEEKKNEKKRNKFLGMDG